MLLGNQRLKIIQQNWRSAIVVYQPIPSSSNYVLESRLRNLGNRYNQNQSFQNYLSLLVAPEDVSTNNDLETSPKQTINNNIFPATITNDELLAAIFLFKIERPTKTPLFSEAAFNTKSIIVMYTNAKIDRQAIKLILNSGSAGSIITQQLIDQLDCQVDCIVSTKIITADGATKTPIGEIDNFSIKVNGIIVLIKGKKKKKTSHKKISPTKLPVAEKVPIQLTSDQNHLISHSSAKTTGKSCSLWELELHPTKTTRHELITIANHVTVNAMATQNAKARIWNNILGRGGTSIFRLDGYSHDKNKIWRMANAKIEDASPSEILEIKNNFSEPVKVVLILNAFLDIETGPEKFYEHYQNLAPIQKEQEQHLEEINT
ncbi:hypothetical protein G9A89_021502 [Geosiphon pyriformis]|nr:hypothetical protein G9A89_021502 [Geosiphon pyriformis]